MKNIFKKSIFALLALIIFSCTQKDEIQTESIYNQLLLNEQRNSEVVEKLIYTIEVRGNRSEELVLLNKATSLISLKETLGLTSNQIEKSSSYSLQATNIFLDSIVARFELVYENNEFIEILMKTRIQIGKIDIDNEDQYLHELLQISYCETNLFAYYGDEVGANELVWEDDLNEDEFFPLDSLATGLNFEPRSNYKMTKLKAIELRESLAQAYLAATSSTQKEVLLDSAQNLFTDYLLNKVIPYWYNTKWEFDGYTAVPQKGAIACGYFVSTTLKHMGVNVNRYKLAQQNPENESSSVAIAHANLKKYKFDELGKDILPELSSYKDGLYFVGLDYHVGYLYIKNKQPYFIHSDFLEGYVRIESAKTSSAFESYEYFISPISNNPQFILKWLLQEEIVVKRG